LVEATHEGERGAALGPAGGRTAVRQIHETSASTYRSDERAASGLRELVEVVTDVWHSRELLQQLTLRDIRIRYKQAVMGFGWAIFMPLLVVGAGLLIRFSMAQVSGGTLQNHAVGGMAVKALAWSFFVGAIGFATPSLIGSQGLVTKVYFPREILPLSTIVAQAFDSAIGAVALALLLPFLGAVLTPQLLWLPLLVVLLVLFTSAAGLLLSCGNLFFRDVKYIVQVLLTFGIFFTPVLFEPAMLGPTGAKLVMLNPLAPLLEGFRLSVVQGHNLAEPLMQLTKSGAEAVAWQPWYLLYSGAWAVLGLIGSALMFHRLEFVFAEYV
jgi:lipopolysaccharide transport system permease protein